MPILTSLEAFPDEITQEAERLLSPLRELDDMNEVRTFLGVFSFNQVDDMEEVVALFEGLYLSLPLLDSRRRRTGSMRVSNPTKLPQPKSDPGQDALLGSMSRMFLESLRFDGSRLVAGGNYEGGGKIEQRDVDRVKQVISNLLTFVFLGMNLSSPLHTRTTKGSTYDWRKGGIHVYQCSGGSGRGWELITEFNPSCVFLIAVKDHSRVMLVHFMKRRRCFGCGMG